MLLIGAKGWDHDEWENTFYPGDLPKDWRLTYYANEFRTVLVPLDTWFAATQDEISRWFEETDEEFIFFFEVGSNTATQKKSSEFRKKFGALLTVFEGNENRIGGILVDMTEPEQEPEVLTAIDTVFNRFSIAIDFSTAVPAAIQQKMLVQWQANACWHGAEPLTNTSHGKIALGLIDSQQIKSMHQLKAVLKDFIQYGRQKHDCVLFFSGKRPSIELMRNAIVINNLLA
jgi:uncharacterized protein YecE (DUF72 family)